MMKMRRIESWEQRRATNSHYYYCYCHMNMYNSCYYQLLLLLLLTMIVKSSSPNKYRLDRPIAFVAFSLFDREGMTWEMRMVMVSVGEVVWATEAVCDSTISTVLATATVVNMRLVVWVTFDRMLSKVVGEVWWLEWYSFWHDDFDIVASSLLMFVIWQSDLDQCNPLISLAG